MPKKVKVAESCVFTTSDGQHNLVDQAKEALTTLSKNKIDVYIFLDETSKDDAAKFLKDNSVPYKALITPDDKPEDGKKPTFDACVLPKDKGFIILRYSWSSVLSDITDKLYGTEQPSLTAQQRMDDNWKDYVKWATKSNKAQIVGSD